MKQFMKLLLFHYSSNLWKLKDEKTKVLVMQNVLSSCISLIASNGELIVNSSSVRSASGPILGSASGPVQNWSKKNKTIDIFICLL